jgi:hypothetical protein
VVDGDRAVSADLAGVVVVKGHGCDDCSPTPTAVARRSSTTRRRACNDEVAGNTVTAVVCCAKSEGSVANADVIRLCLTIDLRVPKNAWR